MPDEHAVILEGLEAELQIEQRVHTAVLLLLQPFDGLIIKEILLEFQPVEALAVIMRWQNNHPFSLYSCTRTGSKIYRLRNESLPTRWISI